MTSQLPLFDPCGTAKERPHTRHFHVRSHTPVHEVRAGERKAERQEFAILRWFRAQDRGHRATPSEVHAAFPDWELTSCRRALTVLTNELLLVHWPGDRRQGPRGARESVWSLAEVGR